jgi:Protein of unknown function (DUF2938)
MGLPKEMRRALPASVPAGVLATVTMDAALVLASRFASDTFASDKIGLEMIGRWAGSLGRGRWRCCTKDITAEPRLRGELAIGFAVHYLTGIALTETYFALLRRSGLRPGPVKATAFGLATTVLPLLVLYPSMGYGCCARRSGDAARLVRIMLLGHTAFGAGIGLWTAFPWGRAAAE